MQEIMLKWRNALGLVFAFALGGLIMLLPAQPGLTAAGQKSIALLVWLITMYVIEPVPLPICSLLVVPMAVFLGIAKVSQALNGYASSAIFMLLGAFVMAAAMEKSGAAERLTYWLLSKIGCTATRITLGMTVANIALAFIVPSTTARTALLLPVTMGIIELVKKANPHIDQQRSNFAVGLLMIMCFTNSTISAGVLTSSIPNPVVVDFLFKATGKMISYAEWFVYGFPPALIMTIFTWWYIGKVCKAEIDEIPGGTEFIKDKLSNMGKISIVEWKTIAIFGVIGLLWATQSMTKIDTTMAALVGVGLFFLLDVIKWPDFAKGGAFNILLVMGGGFSAGEILLSTGAAKWVAMTLLNLLGLVGATTTIVMLVIMIVVQYIRLFFQGTTKMATIMMPIIIAMAIAANADPFAVALPAGMLITGFPLLMFYGTTPNVVVYGTGIIKVMDFPKFGFPIATVGILFYLAVAVTYWKWLGLY